MPPRRPSLRAALDELTQDFAEAVLRAVRVAVRSELVGLLEPERMEPRRARRSSEDGPRAAPLRPLGAPTPSRSPRGSSPSYPSAAPRREPVGLELLAHVVEAYADTVIVDPVALLGNVRERSEDNAPVMPKKDEVALPASTPTPGPSAPPGEDLLRAVGGGFVLRRRRAVTAL